MNTNVEGSGCDNAYEHDMKAAATAGAKDALRRVLAAVQIRHEFTEADVRQIAADMGVTL